VITNLPMLHEQWRDCTACDLANWRVLHGQQALIGAGRTGGVMFIGEAPCEHDMREGQVFSHAEGYILQAAIKKLNLDRVYMTNLVGCRSCKQKTNVDGTLRFQKNYKTGEEFPEIEDTSVKRHHVKACRPRLETEIYLVDPVLIITLGSEATYGLLGKKLNLSEFHGEAQTYRLPGRSRIPKEVNSASMRTFEVKYTVIPVFRPHTLQINHANAQINNPTQKFVEGMKRAAIIYDRYMYEVYGERRQSGELTEESVKETIYGQ
jgi:uracil-DNA glycosylase